MRNPGYFETHSLPIDRRLATGLYTLGLAVKHQERQQARGSGLSPTQAQILALLLVDGAKTPSEVSHVLGVSLPTVSDSVRVLVAKRLVKRQPSSDHHRATVLALTREGGVEARRAASVPEFLTLALSTLSDAQQASLLTMLATILRTLQENGQIPAQRMCLTCMHFRPNAHAGPRAHHCALVDAPMSPTHLRLVCDEHEVGTSESQADHWQQFLEPAV